MAKCLAGRARCLPGHNVARLAGHELAVDPVDGTVRGKLCAALPLPDSPLARPQNVLGGHLLSATVGLVVQLLPLPMELKLALGVGLSIALMQGLGLIHPPAGANPLLILLTTQSWPFLWQTVLPGALLLIMVSHCARRLQTSRLTPT